MYLFLVTVDCVKKDSSQRVEFAIIAINDKEAMVKSTLFGINPVCKEISYKMGANWT